MYAPLDITKAGAMTKPVTVKVQNRSPQPEIIPDAAALAKLVRLSVQSLGACPAPTVVLGPRKYPVTLKSKQMLNVAFNVTFDCPNDPADSTSKNPSHDDFRAGSLCARHCRCAS